ncbi:MAG: aminodeoxychorismate synthase component I, partial [Bacteroidales bacterium]
MRSILEFNIDNIDLFAQNLSVLIDTVEVGIMLRGKDNISIPHTNIESRFDILAGINFLSICKPDKNKFDYLQQYTDLTNDWILGYLSYDLKNDIENLTSKNIDELNFPELFFFQPEVLLLLKSSCLYVHYYPQNTAQNDIEKIVQYLKGETQANTKVISAVTFTSRYTKSEYLKTIEQVKKHIARGDIYEMNLCQEFFHRDCSISPAHTFNKLYSISPTPFATFLKVNDMYLMSASPERYIRKDADIVVSQPIKGTAARKDDVAEDALVKEQLKTDTKERAENIMIVDLVRNDLSKVASRGSVFVNELCGIYS